MVVISLLRLLSLLHSFLPKIQSEIHENFKLQITNLNQIPIIQIQNSKRLSWSQAKLLIPLQLYPMAEGLADKGLRIDVGAGNVLVIEYWDLKFICNLVFEIWDFIGLNRI